MTETTVPLKPVPPPVPEAVQLPPALVELPRWVAWLYDWRGGPDWAKQPYTPATGQWKGWQKGATTFEEACKGAVKFHGDGVGFKPEPDDPYILVDFDDVLKDGVLDAVVAMWLKWFPTYTEISPSGHGLRLVVKGHLPYTITNTKLPGSDKASVELYDGHSGRYVTITGNHWGEPHLEIEEDQIGVDKLLTAIGYDPTKVPGSAADDNDRPTTLEQIRAVYEKHLDKFRTMKLPGDSQNDQLNICALIAARGFLAGAFEKTEDELKSELRAIALSSGHCPGIDRTLDSGWDSGIEKGPFKIQEDRAKEALKYLDDFLADPDAAKPSLKELADVCADAEPEEVATRKKELAKRLKVTVKDFDTAVGAAKRRVAQDPKRKMDPADLTVEIVKKIVEHLLDRDPDEAAKKAAEDVIWDYMRTHAKVFCCNNQGYFLMHEGNGVAIDVGTDSHEFDKLLIGFGVHPGSPSHDRIGEFLENMCYHTGVRTETRLSFHFDKKTFTSYAAVQRGKLLKISRMGIEEVPNGHDDQLFVFPDNWQPLLTKPLNEINGVTGMDTPSSGIPVCGPEKTIIGSRCEKRSLCVHALFVDGFLARHLFGGSSFEIRSMDEKQIRILVMAYILFLMMPGVVPERALLESLGPSSSGKTFLLKLIGRTLVGSSFAVRPLPQDIRELETQIIGDFFIAYDNVSTIPQDIRDRFAQAVTGVEVIRRVLFTDKRQLREMSKATISLSAIKAPLPDLEHGNRAIAINFEERPEGTFVSEEELFKVLDSKRDNIILNFLHRMILVLEALHAQKDYVPKVSVRLAGIATFILRIARHEKWEDQAKKLLEAWSKDQTESSAQEDDISIAIAKWMAGKDWKPNVELTIMMLNEDLCAAMGFADKKDLSNRKELSWHGKHLILFNKIAYNLKVYQKRFGMERGKSTLRTSRGTYTYRFNPSPELLEAIRADAKYEKDREPQIDLPGVA